MSDSKTIYNDQKIAHLTFIQNVISRMGNNSFLLKGWSITIVVALFALSSNEANSKFILIVYFPVIMFWLLDGFFLFQEKLFRKLYEEVSKDIIKSDEFTLDVNTIVNKGNIDYVSSIFSKTLIPFHIVILSGVIFITSII